MRRERELGRRGSLSSFCACVREGEGEKKEKGKEERGRDRKERRWRPAVLTRHKAGKRSWRERVRGGRDRKNWCSH